MLGAGSPVAISTSVIMKTEEAVNTTQVALSRIDPDAILLDKWHNGSEAAFSELVERHHPAMVRLVRSYVPFTRAEEIAQDAWIAVLKGAERLQRRSSFKIWLFRVVIRCATAEKTTTDAPAFSERLTEDWHFFAAHHARAGTWVVPPRPWNPEERLMTWHTLACISSAIASLPPNQQRVLTLRDVDGWTSPEVSELLGITDGMQRVLLHRGRIKLRNALEEFFSPMGTNHEMQRSN